MFPSNLGLLTIDKLSCAVRTFTVANDKNQPPKKDTGIIHKIKGKTVETHASGTQSLSLGAQ